MSEGLCADFKQQVQVVVGTCQFEKKAQQGGVHSVTEALRKGFVDVGQGNSCVVADRGHAEPEL